MGYVDAEAHLFLWLAIVAAWAHSPEFGVTSLSARADAPDELWATVSGWGVLHSTDGGASFAWLCEESIGTATVYDTLSWADGTAFVATVDGLTRVDASCSGQSVTGLPEGFVLRLAAWQSSAAAALIGPDRGGVYRCDDTGCAPTALEGPAFYPKSLYAEGETLWVTLVHTDTLAAELYSTTDGTTFNLAHSWPNGDTDPRVLWASGDTVYVWARPRSDAAEPAFLLSKDGGATFTSTFSTGYYTDPAPGTLVLDGGTTVFLGSWYGARTWMSEDGGGTFTEVSAEAPALRCGVDLGDHALVCTDHLADGFDVASTSANLSFTPVTCLEDVLPAACAESACSPYVDAWVSAAAYGGGQCNPSHDSGTPDPEPDCGSCAAAGGDSAFLPAIVALVLRRRRRR